MKPLRELQYEDRERKKKEPCMQKIRLSIWPGGQEKLVRLTGYQSFHSLEETEVFLTSTWLVSESNWPQEEV
jgi:hypothetical protein